MQLNKRSYTISFRIRRNQITFGSLTMSKSIMKKEQIWDRETNKNTMKTQKKNANDYENVQ